MLNETQLKILASFFPALEEATSKEIEAKANLSHETAFRNLKLLTKTKHLKERKVGKTNVYKFLFADDTYLVYTYFMTEKTNQFKECHSLLYKRLKEFANMAHAYSVVLFGSYAKGTEKSKSDIDVLVVSNKKNMQQIASAFKTKYDIKINTATVKSSDFKNIKKDNKTFYDDLIHHGIVIDGLEFFFKEVYYNE